MNEQAFLWILPALVAAVIGLQLRYRRIPLGWSASGWHVVDRARDESRFWLFIGVESLLVLVLIGQAISA
jgi:hypothetical protein